MLLFRVKYSSSFSTFWEVTVPGSKKVHDPFAWDIAGESHGIITAKHSPHYLNKNLPRRFRWVQNISSDTNTIEEGMGTTSDDLVDMSPVMIQVLNLWGVTTCNFTEDQASCSAVKAMPMSTSLEHTRTSLPMHDHRQHPHHHSRLKSCLM